MHALCTNNCSPLDSALSQVLQINFHSSCQFTCQSLSYKFFERYTLAVYVINRIKFAMRTFMLSDTRSLVADFGLHVHLSSAVH